MKAVLLFESHQAFRTLTDRIIVMKMDLYELPETELINSSSSHYRFSWIAFDKEEPAMRVLFDCHPPKGPHFHIDEDKRGQSFTWSSLPAAIQLFYLKVKERFGELLEIPEEGGLHL